MRQIRIYNSNTLEIWQLECAAYSCRLIMMDLGRPSTASDYPFLSSEEKELFIQRDDHIKVVALSSTDLNNDEKSEVSSLVEDLLDHITQAHCNWNIVFETTETIETLQEKTICENGFHLNINNICRNLSDVS